MNDIFLFMLVAVDMKAAKDVIAEEEEDDDVPGKLYFVLLLFFFCMSETKVWSKCQMVCITQKISVIR